MKTKYLMAGLLLLAVGCSDGILPAQGGTTPGEVAPLPPEVLFTADKTVVDAGESITLSWEVEGADKVEIRSSGERTNFNYSTEDQFKSSTSVNDLQETTTFILTATKLPGSEEEAAEGEGSEGEQPATGMIVNKQAAPEGEEGVEGDEPTVDPTLPAITEKRVTVTVRQASANLSISSFYAEAPEAPDGSSYLLDAGEKTVLHWSILPEDAVVSLTSSTGEQPIVGDCEAESVEALESEGEIAGATELLASGCASVQPTEDSTYTLTATSGEQSATQDLVIRVTKAPVIEYFTVNGSENLRVSSYPVEVELAWSVRPSNATVRLTGDSPVGIPERTLLTEDSLTVTVNQNTKFTLTATVEGEEPATADASVGADLSAVVNCEEFVASGPTSPVFSGELVKISWILPAGAETGVILFDQAEITPESGNEVVLAARAKYTLKLMVNGAERCSRDVTLPIVSFTGETSEKSIRVVGDPADIDGAYVGVDSDGFNGGNIQVNNFNPKMNSMEIDFFGAMQSYNAVTGSFNGSQIEAMVKTFPVNAIAKSDSGRLFVATTGVIVYSETDAEGKVTWKPLTTLLRTDDNGDYPGEHPTCFGKMQQGKQSDIEGVIVSMGQVCDMALDGSKLYIATDRGLYYLNDVEARITDASTQGFHPGRNEPQPLYGKVINDVAVVGSDVYSAGSMGVYKNGEPILEGVLAYSVAVTTGEVDQSIIVVGVEGGVKVKEFGPMALDSAWEDKPVEGSAYSVVADPYMPGVVYVGASSGFYVSRDGGDSFVTATPVEEGEESPVVRSVAAVYSGDPNQGNVKFYLYLATETGVLRAYLENVTAGSERQIYDDGGIGPEDVLQGGDPDAGISAPPEEDAPVILPGALGSTGYVNIR